MAILLFALMEGEGTALGSPTAWQSFTGPGAGDFGASGVLGDGRLIFTSGTTTKLLNTSTLTWSDGPARPSGGNRIRGTVLPDGNFYTGFGFGGSGFHRYNYATDDWTTLAVPPIGGYAHGVAYGGADGDIYIFAGDVSFDRDWVYKYDVSANTWNLGVFDNQPYAGDGRATVTLEDGRIFIGGGTSQFVTSTEMSEFTIYNPDTTTFAPAASYPTTNIVELFSTRLQNGNPYYACGSSGQGGQASFTYEYDVGTNQWTQRTSVPSPGGWNLSSGFLETLPDGRVVYGLNGSTSYISTASL